MSPYLDQILGIYAPDVPGVREALTAIVERELRDARMLCNGSCDIELARRQVGPDGDVPGNARECAELWEREASRLWSANLQAHTDAALQRQRAERAEADAATLREIVRAFLCSNSPVYDSDDDYNNGIIQGYGDAVEKLRNALTSGGQG